jgi:hypothetical protein
MVNTTVKEVTNPVAGQDADHAGGTDWNQLVQVMKGTHATERIQSSSIEKTHWVTKTTSPVTLTETEEYVLADATSNAITLNLPSAVLHKNGHYCIKKVDSALAYMVTIEPDGTETIDGQARLILDGRGEVADIVSDGANWRLTRLEKVGVPAYRAKGATLNRWYSNELNVNTAAIAAVPVAGTMYALPLIIQRVVTIDSVAINVTTGGAGSAAEVGIYADNGNLYPGALVADFGSQATTGTGVKTYTANLPVTLLPGLYWLAFVCSATAPQVSGWAVGQMAPILGTTSALTALNGLGWSVTQAYGALPNPFTAGGAVITAVPCPAVFWRTSG